MAKREGAGNRGQEFWAEAVKRMNAGESVASLAQELGIKERRLYRWRAKLEPAEKDPRRQREAAPSVTDRLNGDSPFVCNKTSTPGCTAEGRRQRAAKRDRRHRRDRASSGKRKDQAAMT